MHTCKGVANGVAVHVHVGVLSLTNLPDQSWLIRLCMHDTVVPCTYMYMYIMCMTLYNIIMNAAAAE